MKISANKKQTASVAVVVCIAVFVALFALSHVFGFASTRSALRVGCVEHAGMHDWSASYTLLDGTMRKTISPRGDTLHITVETRSGSVAIALKDADGNVIFDESVSAAEPSQAETEQAESEQAETTQAETFQVDVSGKVTATIRADHHKGGFSIE